MSVIEICVVVMTACVVPVARAMIRESCAREAVDRYWLAKRQEMDRQEVERAERGFD